MLFGDVEDLLSDQLHPLAPHHLPAFITAPGDTDVLMVAIGIFLVGAVLAVGVFYLHLHSSFDNNNDSSFRLGQVMVKQQQLAIYYSNIGVDYYSVFIAIICAHIFFSSCQLLSVSDSQYSIKNK